MALDIELEKRLRQVVDDVSKRYIGINLPSLNEDLTTRLANPQVPIDIDDRKSYRDSKKSFRKAVITRQLILNLGNISEAARILQIDRRSLHRMVSELDIDVKRIKKELARPYYLRKEEVSSGIESVLGKYRGIIHPDKLEAMYNDVDSISETLVEMIPEKSQTLHDADEEFERAYLRKVISRGQSMNHAAKQIGLRHETLLRKTKALGLRSSDKPEKVIDH